MIIEEENPTPIQRIQSPSPMLVDFSESKDELINPLDNVKVLSIGHMNGIYPRITEDSVDAISKPNGFQKMTPTNTGTFADLKMPSKTLFT